MRVIELGSLIAGPYAGRLLADFGAEVIKVEDPLRPGPLRQWGNARLRGRTSGGRCRAGTRSRCRPDTRVPVGQVHTIADIFADPLFAERDLLTPAADAK